MDQNREIFLMNETILVISILLIVVYMAFKPGIYFTKQGKIIIFYGHKKRKKIIL
jgi:hypothetical protein